MTMFQLKVTVYNFKCGIIPHVYISLMYERKNKNITG